MIGLKLFENINWEKKFEDLSSSEKNRIVRNLKKEMEDYKSERRNALRGAIPDKIGKFEISKRDKAELFKKKS